MAKFCENPGPLHWRAVKRVISYLAGTRNHVIRYTLTKSSDGLIGFTDADYGGDLDQRKSTSGYVFHLLGGPIAWASRHQTCVALSTTEAEFVAGCEAAKEAVWISRLLEEIDLGTYGTIPIHCDNQGAIRLIHNPEFHQRTKHIEIKYYFIREHQRSGVIDVRYLNTEEQVADIFTKALPVPCFRYLRDLLGIVEIDGVRE